MTDLSAEELSDLKQQFVRELEAGFQLARRFQITLESDSTDVAAYEELQRFFHRVAGTAASVDLALLGHLGAVCERAAGIGRGGKGSAELARLLREGLEGVGAVLSAAPTAKRSRVEGSLIAGTPAVGAADEISMGRILVVDDDPFSATLMEDCLRAAGFRSTRCTDSTKALAMILSELPDLVILDVVMPGIDGFELCRQLRAHPALTLTPVIFVTRKGDLEQRVRGLEVGGNDYVSKPFEPQELVARARSHLQRLATLRDMAVRDGLTRCFNHNYFKARLEQELARSRRYGLGLALGMLDVDFFKRVNDTHGHPAGDAVLMNLANLVSASVRSTDVVARYGGEEFGLLLVSAGLDEASIIAERMRERVAQHAFLGPAELRLQVTVSIGLTEIAPGDGLKSLLDRADEALYAAKGAGRNRVNIVRAR